VWSIRAGEVVSGEIEHVAHHAIYTRLQITLTDMSVRGVNCYWRGINHSTSPMSNLGTRDALGLIFALHPVIIPRVR
jgi:hypothetical protein